MMLGIGTSDGAAALTRLIISLNLACSKIYHASGEGMPMLLISSRRTQHLLQVCCSQKSISLVLVLKDPICSKI